MKGKISNEGELYIERAGRMVSQLCPYRSSAPHTCGDWCPLFGEPSREYACTIMGQDCFTKNTILNLCNKKMRLTEFKDERVTI